MQVENISIDLIDIPKHEMRENVSREYLEGLAESIRDRGLINPISVKKVGDRYEVVAGCCRYLAHKILQSLIVPCFVVVGDDREMESIKIHENLYREDVNPVDEAKYYGMLINEKGFSVDDIIKLSNKTAKYVEGRYELLSYDAAILAAISGGKINLSVAKELMKFRNPDVRFQYLSLSIENGASSKTVCSWRLTHECENGLTPADGGPIGPIPILQTYQAPAKDCWCCGMDLSGLPLFMVMACPVCARELKNIAGRGVVPAPAIPPKVVTVDLQPAPNN